MYPIKTQQNLNCPRASLNSLKLMEALAVASTISGLLPWATQILKAGYGLIQSVREFRHEFLMVANEVAQLVGVLHALASSTGYTSLTVTGSETPPKDPLNVSQTSSPSSDSDSEYETIHRHSAQSHLAFNLDNELRSCRQTLRDVESMLQRFSPKSATRR